MRPYAPPRTAATVDIFAFAHYPRPRKDGSREGLRLMWGSRVKRLIAAGAMAAATTLAGPATASAITVDWYDDDHDFFAGSSCGAVDAVTWSFAARAFDIDPVRPVAGQKITDYWTGRTVATVRGATVSRLPDGSKRVRWEARGTDHVCTNPGAYPDGWETRDVYFRVNYSTNEPVYFYDVRDQRLRKPRSIYFGASGRIKRIRWGTWDGPRARGRGRFPFNDCRPSCAEGDITWYRVKTILSNVRYCGGSDRYTKLTYVFRRKPPGVNRRQTVRYGYLC